MRAGLSRRRALGVAVDELDGEEDRGDGVFGGKDAGDDGFGSELAEAGLIDADGGERGGGFPSVLIVIVSENSDISWDGPAIGLDFFEEFDGEGIIDADDGGGGAFGKQPRFEVFVAVFGSLEVADTVAQGGGEVVPGDRGKEAGLPLVGIGVLMSVSEEEDTAMPKAHEVVDNHLTGPKAVGGDIIDLDLFAKAVEVEEGNGKIEQFANRFPWKAPEEDDAVDLALADKAR